MKQLMVVFACLVLAAGCKKKEEKVADDKAGDTKAAAPKAAEPAKPAGGEGCVPGAIKSDEGGFCVAMPANVKATPPYDKDDTSRRFDYGDEAGKSLTVVVTTVAEDPAASWESEVSQLTDESKKPNHKDAKSMDLPGGGKFTSWVEEDGTWSTALTHKDKKIMFCRTHSKDAADVAIIDACKSLRAL